MVGAYYTRAKSLVQQQDLDGAIFQLQQANKLARESPNTNFNLSLLYEAQDQLIPALTHAGNYLKLAPMAVDRGDVETRIAALQEELRKIPGLSSIPHPAGMSTSGPRASRSRLASRATSPGGRRSSSC